MRLFKKFALAGLLSLISIGVSFADDGYIVRAAPGSGSALAAQYGSAFKDISHDNGAYLLRLPNNPFVQQALQADLKFLSVESNNSVVVPETVSGAATQFAVNTYSGANPKYIGQKGTYWPQVPGAVASYQGQTGYAKPSSFLYLNQPGILKINLPNRTDWRGLGVRVAVIDTWIDASNSWLTNYIDKGAAFDTITNKPFDSTAQQETSPFIDQETSPFIDSTGTVMIAQETSPFIDSTGTILLNQETSPFIDQETSPFIDQETSPFIDKNGRSLGVAYAHGTMVAGLVHRVAWDAMLVPIRAFHNDGSGSMADVIQGIYYAVDQAKVQVINMSFSAPTDSAELKKAIKYAQDRGVICVASVSNSNSFAKVYPAALEGVVGVAATDYFDFKASFSDYGSDVEIASPGVYMTSTAPRDTNLKDHWGMANGTSFATPCVAGAAAVLKSLNFSIDAESISRYLDRAADPILDPIYRGRLGSGRLDVKGSALIVKGDN